MEPLTILEPKDDFLGEVKKMAHHYGALLMFDEIITGFRFAHWRRPGTDRRDPRI